jgi:homoserine kinase
MKFETIKLRAPSTSANVGPGYDIFSLALAEPYDSIEVTLTDTNKINIIVDGGEFNNIPHKVEDNSGGLAILELLKRKNLKQGVDLKIIKSMPSGCGLGTTGATASGAIYGLNKLLNLNMSDNEMIDLARCGEVASGGSPHADNVASALLGGFVLVKSYSPIDVLRLDIPEFSCVLAVMRKPMKTTRGFITYEIGQEMLKDQMAHCSTVIHAIHTKDIRLFGKAISTDHIAEPVRGSAIPNYWDVKKEVLDMGAYGFTISGGGSSVIAFCEKDKQDEIANLLQQRFSSNPGFIKVIKTFTSNNGITEL